ncbi:hypothetical protein AAC387_Pa09g0796 [Persea americana]
MVVCSFPLLLDFERSGEGNKQQEHRFSYLLSRRRGSGAGVKDRLLLFVYMGTSAHKEYQAFVDKVERTVYLDNLSPHVMVSVLKTALGQFGNVVNAQFIPNYMDARNLPQCALVEMETAKQAKSVVTEMTMYPFMMSGMPRPVRARPAEPEMFGDRPARPGRKITCRWVDSKDPDVEIAKKLKYLTKKHCAESSFLLKHQLEEEQKLAKQQDEFLKSNYKKYDMLDSVRADGTVRRVARHYDVIIRDD